MAGFFNEAIEVDKNKKPKDNSWKSCLKMMRSPDDFMKKLMEHKDIIDANLVPPANMRHVRDNYITNESFRPEIMEKKSMAAKGVCDWCINMVKYWEVI